MGAIRTTTKLKVKRYFEIGSERALTVIKPKWVTLINYLFDNNTFDFRHTFTETADTLQMPESTIRTMVYSYLDRVIEAFPAVPVEGGQQGIIDKVLNKPKPVPPPPMTYETSWTPLASVMLMLGYKMIDIVQKPDQYSYDKFFFKFHIEDPIKFEKMHKQFEEDKLVLPVRSVFEHHKRISRLMYEKRKEMSERFRHDQ